MYFRQNKSMGLEVRIVANSDGDSGGGGWLGREPTGRLQVGVVMNICAFDCIYVTYQYKGKINLFFTSS